MQPIGNGCIFVTVTDESPVFHDLIKSTRRCESESISRAYVPTFQSFRFASDVRMNAPLRVPTKTDSPLISVSDPQAVQIYTDFSPPQINTDDTRMGIQILHP